MRGCNSGEMFWCPVSEGLIAPCSMQILGHMCFNSASPDESLSSSAEVLTTLMMRLLQRFASVVAITGKKQPYTSTVYSPSFIGIWNTCIVNYQATLP